MSHDDVEILKKKVDRILFYLDNDSGTGQQGLVAEVHGLKSKLDTFISSYNNEKSYERGKSTVYGAIGGAVIMALGWIVTAIIKALF